MGDITGVWKQAESNHRLYSQTGGKEGDIQFLTLGLTGEAGEAMEAILDAAGLVAASGKVANYVKKRWRDHDGWDDEIRKEVADVCAYAFMLANTMGMTPETLVQTIADKQAVFVAKMQARQP